jgi:Fibronectin type III domain
MPHGNPTNRKKIMNLNNRLRGTGVAAAVFTTLALGVGGAAQADSSVRHPTIAAATALPVATHPPTAALTDVRPGLGPMTDGGSLTIVAAKPPTAPRSPTATPLNARVKLAWRRPSSNGGAAINRYFVQRARHSGGPWKRIASPTARSYTATGLTNGTRYYFRIAAHNAAGRGAYSTVVSAVPRTVPSAPTGVATNPSYKHVALIWLAPPGNGAKIDKYEVQKSTNQNSGWGLVGYPTTTTTTATGLTNGTRYYFRIRAHNAAGWGPFSYPVSAVPYWNPDAPASCTAVQSSPGSVYAYVNWSAPSSDGGAAIESYDVSLWRLGKEYDRHTVPSSSPGTAVEVSAFGAWEVHVQARNAAGLSLDCVTFVTMN